MKLSERPGQITVLISIAKGRQHPFMKSTRDFWGAIDATRF